MKIQEIAVTQADADSLFSKLQSLVDGVEGEPPTVNVETLDILSECAIKLPFCFVESQKEALWTLSYKLWNRCVVLSNVQGGKLDGECIVKLRQAACDMLLLSGGNPSVKAWEEKVAFLLYKTALACLDSKKVTAAESCLLKASELLNACELDAVECAAETMALKARVLVARAKAACTACNFQQAGQFLDSASDCLCSDPNVTLEVAEQSLLLGKHCLKENAPLALRFLQHSYELSTSAQAGNLAVPCVEAKQLRLHALRFLAGAQLQCGLFNDCLKCTALLKLNCATYPAWASFLELKALASLGRHEEALHEFKSLVAAQDLNVEILCASFEAVIEAETSFALDVSRGLLLQACQRFSSDSRPICFSVERLLSKPSPPRIAAALRIIKDEKVQVQLRNSKQGSEDNDALFILLWNTCAETFRLKDYNSALKLVEGCLLFIRDDATRDRAKALRVISLCHMAMSQPDLAMDAVSLAEEFKLHLQQQESSQAEGSLCKMLECPDFDADYLALAAQEALACGLKPVAVVALKKLLSLYPEGKGSKTTEGAVAKALIQEVENDSSNGDEVLKLFLLARDRSESSADVYFGTGDQGLACLKWFAASTLLRGVELAKAQDWLRASSFLKCSSTWFSALPVANRGQIGKMSLMLAASALLACHTETKPCVKEAESMLRKCQEAFSQDEETLQYLPHLRLLQFEAKAIMHDTAGQQNVIEICKTTPNMSAELFFRLAIFAASAKKETGSHGVAWNALCAGLGLLDSTTSCSKAAFVALRSVIMAYERSTATTKDLQQIYREAFQLIQRLPQTEVPPAEVSWFIATAWNKVPVLVKFQHFKEALSWVELAVQYVQLAPSLAQHKTMMLQVLEDVKRAKAEEQPNSLEE